MTTKQQIDGKIRQHQNEIAKLKVEKKMKAQFSAEQRIAEFLHNEFCHFDHTTGCSFTYEKWSDLDCHGPSINTPKGRTHSEKKIWLQKARRLIEGGWTEDDVIDFVLRLNGKLK